MLKPFKLLRTTLAAAMLAATSIGANAVANPYDEYAGTTLVVNFPAHPHYLSLIHISEPTRPY